MLGIRARARLNYLTNCMDTSTYEEVLEQIEKIVDEVYGVELKRENKEEDSCITHE